MHSNNVVRRATKSFCLIEPKNRKPPNYWRDEGNVICFLEGIKEKYNLQSFEDWSRITNKEIISNGGRALLSNYSMYDLKCIACPEGKLWFENNSKQTKQPPGYWNNEDNILQFLGELRENYNLKSFEDWNSISRKKIQSNGGITLLNKYSLMQLKHMGFYGKESQFFTSLKSKNESKTITCSESKLRSVNNVKPSGYWNNYDNILQFLDELKEKYNLRTIDDFNSITFDQIQSNGGRTLLNKFSLYEIKCMAYPEGKSKFDKPNKYKPPGYWKNDENIHKFLDKLKKKYNLKSPEDWNLITQHQIQINGGRTLLHSYSMYDIKCIAFPEGKSKFIKSEQPKPAGYWENEQNVIQFLEILKEKYNLQTPEDWNAVTHNQIQSNGGSSLLNIYSMYELKCIACPSGKEMFKNSNPYKSLEYWKDENNRNHFIDKLKMKFNLKTPQDWKRLSVNQIKLEGGFWLFYNNNEYLKKTIINFGIENDEKSLHDLIIKQSKYKKSSQRWLFLQIQKLFPGQEIVEDYFHSGISRETGVPIQFDIFLIGRNIAFEYHGKQHYEEIPSAFASMEMHKNRDLEKQHLCKKYGIRLIIIPYWWDNKLESLKETLNKQGVLQQ